MAQNSHYCPPILIERGSYITHCGYAGRDKTELSFRTPSISIEAQFKHIFEDVLKVDPVQHKVVIVKDAGTAQQGLRDEAHILFTRFHVKACAFVNAQIGIIFSLAVNGSDALIIDIGYESTLIVPCIEFMIPMAFMAVVPMAGRIIEQFIIGDLRKHGIAREIIENHKEQLFPYLMRDYYYFDSESEHDFEREAIEKRKKEIPKCITLQDKEGKIIELALPSPVLPPELIIEKHNSRDLSFSKEISKHVIKILDKFGVDHLLSFYEYSALMWVPRIIITGGASNILGLRSLLIRVLLKTTELKRNTDCERAPSSPLVEVMFRDVGFTIRNETAKKIPSTWIGGSITASLTTFEECFVSQEMYHKNPDLFFQLDKNMTSGLSKFIESKK